MQHIHNVIVPRVGTFRYPAYAQLIAVTRLPTNDLQFHYVSEFAEITWASTSIHCVDLDREATVPDEYLFVCMVQGTRTAVFIKE